MEKILLVDDEPNILDGYKRSLRKYFEVDTAQSGQQALLAIQSNVSYAVIVSDMRMPGMDGVEFLARAKQICPDSVRIMLTGNADQQTAIDAVNEGHIYRFLNKPCSPLIMTKTLWEAIEYHRSFKSKKEMIEKTLSSADQTLTHIIPNVNSNASSDLSNMRDRMRQLNNFLKS